MLLLAALAVFLPAVPALHDHPDGGEAAARRPAPDRRRWSGRLSSIGTLGAITATLGTGFVFVAAMPSSWIVLTLAGLLGGRRVRAGLVAAPAGPRPGLPGKPRTRAALVTVGLVGAGLGPSAPTPCDVETAYHCARVDADPQRAGRADADPQLGPALVRRPERPDAPRVRVRAVDRRGRRRGRSRPAPRSTPCTSAAAVSPCPATCAATRPGSDQLVLELDGGLVDLDKRELGLTTGPDLRVRVGDARVGLAAQPTDAYDLVVGDAFGHLVVPWHLATREMAADIARVLRPGGVYAQNVIDYPPDRFIRAELATVAAVFPHVALIAPPAALAGETGSNFVIVASQTAAAARRAPQPPGPGRRAGRHCCPEPSWTRSSATPGC